MAYTPGKGTKLQLDIASTLTDIAQVTSITPPAMEMGTVETTHLASTWREYISTIPDGGTVEATIEYDPAAVTHAALWTAFTGGGVETFKVVFTDAGDAEISFDGIVTNFAPQEANVDNIVLASISIKVTGAVTITP